MIRELYFLLLLVVILRKFIFKGEYDGDKCYKENKNRESCQKDGLILDSVEKERFYWEGYNEENEIFGFLEEECVCVCNIYICIINNFIYL